MQKVNLFDAKTHFSRLIDQIVSGEETEIVIARNGKPVAKVVPIGAPDVSRRIGIAKGEFTVPESIDCSNEAVARLFLGKPSDDAPAA